jgi:hypothetical protein
MHSVQHSNKYDITLSTYRSLLSLSVKVERNNMDTILGFGQLFISGFQTPTLGFLLGGMFIAAMGSRLTIPDQV